MSEWANHPGEERAPAPPGDAREQEVLRRRIRARLFDEPELPVRLGRFRVLSVLGRGGMGVVYEARDERLDRAVAIKVIRDDERGPRERARMLAEARAQARLSHPNVVQIHEVGESGDDVFIVMELVHGVALDAWLAAQPRRMDEVLAVFAAAGGGLAAAHAVGLVHCDIKPSNILVGDEGRVWLADFGLARGVPAAVVGDVTSTRAGATSGGVSATTTRSSASAAGGTPAYMSPEQFVGRPDARSDQYSFCLTLHEALVGRRPSPVDGGHPARTLPRRLRRVLSRGLSFEPERRFPAMTELLAALDPGSRRPLRIAGPGVALALGGVLAGAFVSQAPAMFGGLGEPHRTDELVEPPVDRQAATRVAPDAHERLDVPDAPEPAFLDTCSDTTARAVCDDGTGCDAGPTCPDGGACVHLVYRADACELPASCMDIRRQNPEVTSGVYLVDPDGHDFMPPFNVWCDMATEGGGWTLVWKQTDHASASFQYSAQLLGSKLLLSDAFDGSTGGSLISLFEYGEILFKSSPALWVRLQDRFDDWVPDEVDGSNLCRDLGRVAHACSGVDCSTNKHLAVTFERPYAGMSGYLMGPFAYPKPNPECAAVWCNGKHGRYDGMCASGPRGEGNWMVFVR